MDLTDLGGEPINVWVVSRTISDVSNVGGARTKTAVFPVWCAQAMWEVYCNRVDGKRTLRRCDFQGSQPMSITLTHENLGAPKLYFIIISDVENLQNWRIYIRQFCISEQKWGDIARRLVLRCFEARGQLAYNPLVYLVELQKSIELEQRNESVVARVVG